MHPIHAPQQVFSQEILAFLHATLHFLKKPCTKLVHSSLHVSLIESHSLQDGLPGVHGDEGGGSAGEGGEGAAGGGKQYIQ